MEVEGSHDIFNRTFGNNYYFIKGKQEVDKTTIHTREPPSVARGLRSSPKVSLLYKTPLSQAFSTV